MDIQHAFLVEKRGRTEGAFPRALKSGRHLRTLPSVPSLERKGAARSNGRSKRSAILDEETKGSGLYESLNSGCFALNFIEREGLK